MQLDGRRSYYQFQASPSFWTDQRTAFALNPESWILNFPYDGSLAVHTNSSLEETQLSGIAERTRIRLHTGQLGALPQLAMVKSPTWKLIGRLPGQRQRDLSIVASDGTI